MRSHYREPAALRHVESLARGRVPRVRPIPPDVTFSDFDWRQLDRYAARRLDRIARELESAARHAWMSAAHFRSGDVPRAAAHVFAAIGHSAGASRVIEEVARTHARYATAPARRRS
jgi:hypothetical protein